MTHDDNDGAAAGAAGRPRVLVAGETLVDLVATDASLADADAFSARAGGAPANVAAGLAALEEPAWLWTRVGADGFGERCRGALEARTVPERFVEIDPERRTTVAVAGGAGDVDAEDHDFGFYRAADEHLGSGDAGRDPTAVLDAVSVLVVGGIALATDPARSAALDLVATATDADCTVVFDPNARPRAWRDGAFPTVVDRVLEHADVVKATPGDLAAAGFDVDDHRDDGAVPPSAGPELARAVCDRGPHTAFLTLGGAGAVAASTDGSPFGRGGATHAGHDVDAVDPTGAGDAFLAGVVAELARGATDPYVVLDVATAAGALATTDDGAMPALPDRAAVDALVDADGGAA